LPAPVVGLHGVEELAVGSAGACALSSRSVWCWGSNDHGDLGVEETACGDNRCTPKPTQVRLPIEARAIKASGTLCVLGNDSGVYCWGRGLYGAAGQPTDRCGVDACVRTPRKLVGIPPLLALASAHDHVCGVTTDELVCWGTLGGFEFSGTKRADWEHVDASCPGCVGSIFRQSLASILR
jgi:serine/threonine-protein kinase